MIQRARIAAVILLISLLTAQPALAQSVTIDLGEGDGFSGRLIQIVLLTTVLSLAPSILIMMTSFIRIVVVLSLLRTAIGVQASPPNPVIISLALFLTAFVMAPTFEEAWRAGVQPMMKDEMPMEEALPVAIAPVKE